VTSGSRNTQLDTILIVDDSSFIVDGLAAILRKTYRTLAAYSGEDCLTILRKETPSVIILDVVMEPIDGWETLSRIREDPATRQVPVLMFSARKISLKDAGKHQVRLDDVIQKPVSPQKIIESIERVLARRDINRYVREKWQRAGISGETVDEYVALTMSLEVDLSLCQNMKLQQDLTPAGDMTQPELRSLIAAIEDRISEERRHIEAMEERMNAPADFLMTGGPGVEHGDDDNAPGRVSSGAAPVPAALAPGCVPVSMTERPDPAMECQPAVPFTQEPEPSGPVSTPYGTDVEPAEGADAMIPVPEEYSPKSPAGVLMFEDELFEGQPAESSTGAVSREGSVPSPPGQSLSGGTDHDTGNPLRPPETHPGPRGIETTTGDAGREERKRTARSENFIIRGSSGPAREKGEDHRSGRLRGVPEPVPGSGEPPASGRPAPAERDPAPSGRIESLPGAGTDLPLPANRLRSGKGTNGQRASGVKSLPPQSGPKGSGKGIMTRILALFRRQK